MLEMLTLHPIDGPSVDKPFQISLPSKVYKDICKVFMRGKMAFPNARMEFIIRQRQAWKIWTEIDRSIL